MTTLVNCPNCRYRGQLRDAVAAQRAIVCPRCKAAVTTEQLRRGMSSRSLDDANFPIFVESASGDVTAVTPPPVASLQPPAPPEPPAESAPPAVEPAPACEPEPEAYVDEFMKEEAGRFATYVASRLAELHKKRAQLTEAESRFELMTMEQKRAVGLAKAAAAAESAKVKEREHAVQAQTAALASREAALAVREAEVASRESRVARAEGRASETDRRTADLRAAIDQLEVRRQALGEEREALNRRAETLDRAELAQHRRAAELDEMDERLRLEQEAFERERAG